MLVWCNSVSNIFILLWLSPLFGPDCFMSAFCGGKWLFKTRHKFALKDMHISSNCHRSQLQEKCLSDNWHVCLTCSVSCPTTVWMYSFCTYWISVRKHTVRLTCSWPRMKVPPGLIGCQAERFCPEPFFTPSWKASQTPSRVDHVTHTWCHFPSVMVMGNVTA